jgi:RNA methyltransferase, TrmH family
VIVTSLHNPRVKQIRALASRKERDRTGLFFVAGLHLVLETMQTGTPIELLVVAPELLRSPRADALVQRASDLNHSILTVSADVFQELAPRALVQGVGAIVRQRWTPLSTLPRPRRLGLVALAGTQYPGNLGSILRTADAVGADGVVLLEATSDPYDPVAVRASVGAIFSMPLARASFAAFVTWTRERSLPIVGTSPGSPLDYRVVHYPTPLVLLMGSEGSGLTMEQLATCDQVVRIPMVGRGDSLNLAVATSVILYEAIGRQLPFDESKEERRDG